MEQTKPRQGLSRAAVHLASAALVATAGSPARAAGEWTACRIENGVLVVPAKAAGLNGPFVLDTGAAHSQIDATQASLAGLEPGPATVRVRLAGRVLNQVAVEVVALDARTSAQPTPITGVLGADVLDGLVLEVWPDPCRFHLVPRAGNEGRPVASLPVERRKGTGPLVRAAVTDGSRVAQGAFRIATGSAIAVSLGPEVAQMEGAQKDAQSLTAPLRALSIGQALVENPPSMLVAAAEPGVLGEIGEPVWAHYGFRLDLKADRLTLFEAKEKTRRKRSGGS
jgi:hypothetical protein